MIFPGFLQLDRTLQMGLKWVVETRISRRSPAGIIVTENPLPPGEKETSETLHIRGGKVQINLGQQNSSLSCQYQRHEDRPADGGEAMTVTGNWRTNQDATTNLATPTVNLGIGSVNFTGPMAVPDSRWILLTGGPRLGPAGR